MLKMERKTGLKTGMAVRRALGLYMSGRRRKLSPFREVRLLSMFIFLCPFYKYSYGYDPHMRLPL